MKRLLIALVFLPTVCFAQGWQIGNPVGTPRALPTPGTAINRANVDTFGNQLVTSVDSSSGARQSIVPVSNATGLNGLAVGNIGWGLIGTDTAEAGTTTTVINATAHVARVGDIIWINSGTLARQWAPVSAVTANSITVSNAFTGAMGVGDQFFIQRPHPIAATNNTNNTAQSLAVFADANFQNSAASGLLKAEDAVAASGDAGVMSLQVLESAITASAASGDYGALKGDTGGRLVTTMAPAGETFYACSGSITTTTSTTIKAAVASNRHYITNITCRNNSATASTMIFTDGTGGSNMAVGSVGATGSFNASFPVPLRQSVNTAFTVTVETTATATICCASGYISTI